MERNIVAAGYDAVYAAIPNSPTFRRLWREHAAGAEFPDEFAHISFVTVPQLEMMADELRLRPGGMLVDVGCGMAGPALCVAQRKQAHLVGVDLSPVALEQALARAEQLGLAKRAEFRIGTFADTGLPDGVTDAVMSEDAIQYAPDKQQVAAELSRILRPEGRLVFTVFELHPERSSSLPVIGGDPVSDYRPLLSDSGFDVDRYEEVPGWPEPMTSAYAAVLAAASELLPEMGQAAISALVVEMSLTLQHRPYTRRVLCVATKRP